ncbi:MAG: hypothetical protein C0391_01440 [Anaerolinea sp.]|nr:hypothetical protein [Anaerolinea sp.]
MIKTNIASTTILSLIISLTLAACFPVEQPQAAPIEQLTTCPATAEPAIPAPECEMSAQPALYGLWLKEQNSQSALLTFTERSVYLVEFDGAGDGYVRETFYEVRGVDWVNGILSLQMKWVRINGKMMGFDDPAKLMKISIEDDALFYNIDSEELGAPVAAETGPWLRQ